MRRLVIGFDVTTSIKRAERSRGCCEAIEALNISQHMAFEGTSSRTFIAVSALLFVSSSVITVVWGASMSTMVGMPMPGGWTMSMTWMPGQDWSGAALSFLGMWVVMMIAMMMPSLLPMLLHYRQAIGTKQHGRMGWLTVLVGAGYFFVWTVFGIAVFPLGVALATAAMQLPGLSRTVPIVVAVVVLIAGLLQFTGWKAQQLACCRQAAGCRSVMPASMGAAWIQGLRFGLHCSQCCFGLIIILLIIGVMDLRVMAIVAAAITAERLAPAGVPVAQITGALVAGVGLFLIARAVF
jgi:predicted metal-binding membrane protein